MRRAIAVAVLAGALAITAVSGAQTGPGHTSLGVSPVTTPGPVFPTRYDQPPIIRLVPKVINKLRFRLRRTVVVGSMTCGTGTCTVSANAAFAAIRRRAGFKATLIAPSPFGAGETRLLRVRLSRKAFRKIKVTSRNGSQNGTKDGLGHTKFRLTLTSSPGYSISAAGNARYKARRGLRRR